MALTDAQTATVFVILGVPQGGAGAVAEQVVSIRGPLYENFDFAGLITAINTKIAALSSDQETLVGALLTRWDELKSYSVVRIKRSGSASGTLADYPQERENIRRDLGNILGMVVPTGGFVAEMRRAFGGGHRIVR